MPSNSRPPVSGSSDITVIELDPSSYEQWFVLEPTAPIDKPVAELRSRVAAQVRQFRPACLRKLVAKRGDVVVARMNALRSHNQGTSIWNPTIRGGEDDQDEIVLSLLRYVKRAPWALRSGPLETKLCRADADAARWELNLRSEGFRLVSESVVMARAAGPPVTTESKLPLESGMAFDVKTLLDLYRLCLVGSLDRESLGTGRAVEKRFEALIRETPPERWRISAVDGSPRALCIIGADEAHQCAPLWVQFIGVDPRVRRQGVAHSLLLGAMMELGESAAKGGFRAFIDVDNIPSLALHRSAGFVEEPPRYATYRYPDPIGN